MKDTYNLLPPINGIKQKFPHFPTAMQAVIFRNWEIVPKQRIADCLECSEYDIEKQAVKMGLRAQSNTEIWQVRGYISIIKLNWGLLCYEQLLKLLGKSEAELALILKDEDFLKFKLGDTKFLCDKIVYRELTDDEEKQTAKIKNIIEKYFPVNPDAKEAFDFFRGINSRKSLRLNKVPKKIVIDSSWSMVDETNNETASKIILRYKKLFEKNLGFSFESGEKKIICKLFDCKMDEEYHEIEICEDSVVITAADSAGILRALVYLEDIINSRGCLTFDTGIIKCRAKFKTRMIYSFCGLYNDALDTDSKEWCPDELLDNYSKSGVNAIWIQGILYRLAKFPFDPSLSDGMEKRLGRLRDLIKRCSEYGIKIFLYFNEPRSMDEIFFKDLPHIMGAKRRSFRCMCTSSEDVKKYVSDAVSYVCRNAEGLGGIFIISSSENLNNCRAWTMDIPCHVCSKRSISEVASEVNNLIIDAAHSVNPDIKVIVWDWGWRREELMNGDDVEKFIKSLSPGAILMSGRERGIPIEKGGIKGEIEDYTLCVTGVGEMAKDAWKWARERGLETAAKLQINNTWECSTIPYLPLFKTVETVLSDIAKEGVEHLMLSWTLGGAPSPNIKVASRSFFETEGAGDDDLNIYDVMYGEDAKLVKSATDKFCDAFYEFPFSHQGIYKGPANNGAANLLYEKDTGLKATMTCFSYDDIESWRMHYPEDVFEAQYTKMVTLWKEGLDILKNTKCEELYDMSRAVFIQLQSSENQIKFIRARNNSDYTKMTELAKAEIPLAIELHQLMDKYPEIGFEAANHYYYTKGMLKEKILNCTYICDKYSNY